MPSRHPSRRCRVPAPGYGALQGRRGSGVLWIRLEQWNKEMVSVEVMTHLGRARRADPRAACGRRRYPRSALSRARSLEITDTPIGAGHHRSSSGPGRPRATRSSCPREARSTRSSATRSASSSAREIAQGQRPPRQAWASAPRPARHRQDPHHQVPHRPDAGRHHRRACRPPACATPRRHPRGHGRDRARA